MDNLATRPAVIWATRLLPGKFTDWEELTPDAGARRYFRGTTNTGHSLIAVNQIEMSKKTAFRQLQQAYTNLGVIVPDIIYASAGDEFLMLSDLGDNLLQDRLNMHNAAGLYRQALAPLRQIRKLCHNTELPLFDKAFFQTELQFFYEWYFVQLQQREFSRQQRDEIWHSFDVLLELITQQPYAGTHRDYHSRNILCLPDGGLGIVDFQDSGHAPLTYDVVSLIYDAYVQWPEECIQAWLSYEYYADPHLHQLFSLDGWLHACWAMSIQRHLKACGTFARKIVLEQNLRYAPSLHTCIHYLRKNLPKHEELIKLSRWIR